MQHIKLEKKGSVLYVTMNRPEVRNAFNEELIQELKEVFSGPACGKGKGYEDVRLAVLSGEGKSFCGGGDLNWMKKSLKLSEAENVEDCIKLTDMFLAIDQCKNPVLGKVQGHAIGGGLGLASVCDHVIAEEGTIFSLSEVKLGLIPACIGPFVLRKIGSSQSRSLFISGERFTAKKALDIGLVHEMVKAEELEAATEKRVQQITQGGKEAIWAAKSLIQNLNDELKSHDIKKELEYAAKSLAKLRVGEEAQEGLRAFLEKREPSWRKS